jgi:uncharacterized FAD-dependent dehydrogenase
MRADERPPAGRRRRRGNQLTARMLRLTELKLPLDHDDRALHDAVLARLGVAEARVDVVRRGYDARRRGAILLVYTVDVAVVDEAAVLRAHAADPRIGMTPDVSYRHVARAPATLARRPVVIGAGPCGLFAALTLSQMGFRPIILERGRVVRQRTKDTFALWRRSVLTPESNVQFGEGGAGTFSDGKLWSGIKDPAHLGRRVLEEFVRAGAPSEILVSSKPHIGTFRLVTVVESLRATIEALGGEYHFDTRVTDFHIGHARDGTRRIEALALEGGDMLETSHVVLAPGHSARDVFAQLVMRGVHVDPKPFSVGVRIEHPQSLIDHARFGSQAGHAALGAADYKLVHHGENGRSTYSFCMCPGGTVVAATSEPGRVVTNGMSQYSRAERNANAGIVVGVTPADFSAEERADPLGGVAFQRRLESLAFEVGGGTYAAPVQRVGDFLAGRASTSLGEVVPSYKPGVTPSDIARVLPDYVVSAIREALPVFGRRIRGFDIPDAVMTAVETRTSSPIRITRNEHFESLNTHGLYPAGEGAGYAGGILSAAVDGTRVAEAVAKSLATGR